MATEKTERASVPHVYQAISKVMGLIAKEGISKDRKNDSQGYAFRGIDDVYNALAPILTEAQLCILPLVKSREVVERQTRSGSALFYVTVAVDFALVSAVDGSTHMISVVGEAMDSGDKATNKAMSAAYKYACMQAFCIPTEGDNDADKTTHEVAAKPKTNPAKASPQTEALAGSDELDVIRKLAQQAAVDLTKIAAAVGVEAIEFLPKASVAGVIAKLQEKIAAQAAK